MNFKIYFLTTLFISITTLHSTAQNVGIGTNTPSQKLDIQGNMAHSGSLISRGVTTASTWMRFDEHIHGNSLVLGSGGVSILGAGESATYAQTNVGLVSERLYFTSDTDMQFITNLDGGWAGREEAMTIQRDGDLQLLGNNSILMPNNIAYSQTTNNITTTSTAFVTLREQTITVEANQKVLVLAWSSIDHDDAEIIKMKIERNGNTLGDTIWYEEDDRSGSWTDEFTGNIQWVDEPPAGTHTYRMSFQQTDVDAGLGAGLTSYASSLVLIKF